MLFATSLMLLTAALRVSAQMIDPLSVVQSNDPAPSDSIVYVDVYESCTDAASATDTVTATITATTCPLCQTHQTVWTTVWPTVCETGMADVTYTITESCTGVTPTWSHGPTYVPSGYTVTQTVCTVCNDQGLPTTVTMTVPCNNTSTPAAMTGSQSAAQSMKPTRATTTTETICHGETTMCPKITSTTATYTRSHTVTMSRASVSPYMPGNAGATALANAWGRYIGGAMAAVGVALL